NRAQQRLGVVPEQAEQQQLLFTGGEALGPRAGLLQPDRRRILCRLRVGRECHGTLHVLVDRRRWRAESPFDEQAYLVDDDRVAAPPEGGTTRPRPHAAAPQRDTQSGAA